MSPRGRAPVALALLLVAAPALLLHSWPPSAEPRDREPAAAIELVLPGLLARGGAPPDPRLGASRPRADDSLPARVLLRESGDTPRGPGLYASLATLLLCAFVLATLPGRAAWALRAAAVALAVLAATGASGGEDRGGLPDPLGRPLAVLLVAGAALGAWTISRPPAPGRAGAELALGAAAVLLAAALAGLALHAGASTDRETLAPLLERLPPGSALARPAATLAADAAHLRAVLDRSALAAFATMTALLLHLKSRRPFTLALLLAVSLLDVLSVRRIL